jgi:cytochrome bd-type quinol oxidase subunit 2
MQMRHDLYVAIFVAAGFLAGLSWSVVTTVCFNGVKKILGYDDGPNRPIGLVDLFGQLLGVAASGGYLLVIIFVAVWWTNKYPEWRSNKDLFWIGIVVGVALLQMRRRRDS